MRILFRIVDLHVLFVVLDYIVNCVAVITKCTENLLSFYFGIRIKIAKKTSLMRVLQWLVGFLTFLLPFSSNKFRAFLKPIHVYFGVMLFIFGVAASYSGMTQILYLKQ